MRMKLDHNKVQQVEIHEEQQGQRIDNFLLRVLKGVPRSRIYRILRKGEVRVNKKRIKPEYRLLLADIVRIPPIRLAEESDPAKPSTKAQDLLNDSILYEDEGLLILNKPSGMAVHGGSGLNYGVIEALRVMRPEARFLELAHRLDRDTSGCLVIAKKRSRLRQFHTVLREGGIHKHYLCLVKGQWQGGRRRIDAPLLKNQLQSGERLVRVDSAGKTALSMFEPVTIYKNTSLMRVELITGRTHQIRVHACYSDHPIVGDTKYGDDIFNKTMAGFGLKRLFLHASTLKFELEGSGKIEIKAPLPSELQRVLDKLESDI